jgi:predicted aspartyl protease
MKRPFVVLTTTLAGAVLLAVPGTLALAQSEAAGEFPDPGTTYLAASPTVLEMNLDLGRPEIELMVNGEGPFKFVVDTGASYSVIDQGIAEKLGLEVIGKQGLYSPGAKEEIQGNRVQAARMESGGLLIEDPVLATMELVKFTSGMIEGVLGRPHFRDLLLTFDYPGSKMVVAEGKLDASDEDFIDYEDQAGSIRFPVDVAGTPVTMVLDTGSPGGFSMPKAIEPQLAFRYEPRSGHTIRLVGGAYETWVAPLDGEIRFAAIDYPDPEVVLTTYSEDFGNIGFKVLRELKVTVDQANQLVRFERGEAPESSGQGPQRVRMGGPVAADGPGAKPQLGVSFDMTPAGFVRKEGGLVVRSVTPGGAADEAGLLPKDVVLTMGGGALAEIDQMMEIVKLVRGPRPLVLEIVRGGEPMTITIP